MPIDAAEFFALGVGTNVDSDRIAAVSADGSTIFGYSVSSASPLYHWTRSDGVEAVPMFDGFSGSLYSGGARASADGSTIAIQRIGSNFSKGGLWTQDSGWHLPPGQNSGGLEGELYAVSSDGSTVVGSSTVGQALRWTRTGGFEELGSLPGETGAVAHSVSFDGSVIVGRSGSQLFRWTSATGMMGIANLPAGYVGWGRQQVSADGQFVLTTAERAAIGSGGSHVYDAFRWSSASGLVPIISDSGIIPIGSEDLSIIVGLGNKRWTQATGQQTLPHLPGQWTNSDILEMSADGRTLFGVSYVPGSNDDYDFGFWLPNGVVKTLDEVLLEQGLASSVAGWTDYSLDERNYYLSADARVLAGVRKNPAGLYDVFVVYLDPLVIPEPASTTLGLLALTLTSCFRSLSSRHAKRVGLNGPCR
jgi:hypothetical protein